MQGTSQFAKDAASSGMDIDEASLEKPQDAPGLHRRSATLETLLFLICMLVIDQLVGSGDRFLSWQVHPFWAIVLLVSLQYGPGEALMAALLSSVFLLVGNLPEQTLTETMYDYIMRVTFLPFLWCMTALILGSIRARQLDERQRMLKQLRDAEETTHILAGSYGTIKQSKEKLELRLAEERCSLLTVYKIAKELETVESSEIEPAILRLVNTALRPKKFSLFKMRNNGFELEACHGWGETDTYAKRYEAGAPLVRALLEKKQALSIVRESDEALLMEEGVMAGSVIDPKTSKVYGMLKIEEMAFTDLNKRNYEIFSVLCEWIARVYANAEKHQATRTRLMTAANTNDIPSSAQYIRFFTKFARRHGLNMFKVTIRMANLLLSGSERLQAMAALKSIIQETLRDTDLLLHAGSSEDSTILLSCYDEADTQLVVAKIQIAVVKRNHAGLNKAKLAYNVQVLHLEDPLVTPAATRTPYRIAS